MTFIAALASCRSEAFGLVRKLLQDGLEVLVKQNGMRERIKKIKEQASQTVDNNIAAILQERS